MNTNSTIRLLAIFILTLSMTAFAGSTNITRSTHLVRADYITTAPAQNSGPTTYSSPLSPDNQWVPAGPMVDKILVTTYSDENGEFGALKANTIDETDWTLSQADVPASCPSGTAIACDSRFFVNQAQGPSSIANYGMFGLDFNHANTFFGVNFGFAKDTNPDNAKAINIRQGIAHLVSRQDVVATQFGTLANAMDNPLPPGQAFAHSGIPFDSTCQPGPAPACTGPYSFGGYNLQGVCGAQTPGVNGGWDTLDAQFRAAGQTCRSAFKYFPDQVDSAGIVTALASNLDFCDAADHWIAAGLATGRSTVDCHLTGLASALSTGNIKFVVRRDNAPRLNFGQALASRLCELINGAGVTTCTQVTVNLLSIQEARPIVFATDVVHLDWHLYTFGWGLGATPEQVWALFNSAFAGKACGGVPGPFGTDYIYVCNANFDHFNNMIEFNNTNAGALASTQMADEIFGQHVFHIDIYAQNDVFAYRKEWKGMVEAKGLGLPTYFSQFNAWSATPLHPGQIDWGWKQGTSNPNPMSYTSQWEFQWNTFIYDSIIASNPYSPTDAFGWMVNQWQVLAPQPGDPAGTVADFKFNLRNDIFFHDGRQVTASDYMFSWQAFANTGGLINPLTAGIVGVRIQNDFNFIVNVNSNSVFGLFNIGGLPIMPQHILAADTTTKCTTVGTPACSLAAAPEAPSGFVDTRDIASGTFHQFIGSGPFKCVDLTTSVVGGACSSTGTGSVPAGASIVLTRDGLNQAGTANSAYFRDSAKWEQWQWADVFNHGTVDILDVSSAASCLGKAASTAGCTHWDTPAAVAIACLAAAGSCNASSLAGLGGNNGGTVTFIEIQQAFRWFGVSWNSPFSYASLSSTTGCGGSGCGAVASATLTTYEGGVTYGPRVTSTSVACARNNPTAVTCTATVTDLETPTSTPVGAVSFAAIVGSCTLTATATPGQANCSVTLNIPTGTIETASYGGSPTQATSSNATTSP